MTSEELAKLFSVYAEDAQFRLRSKPTPEVRFVYACEFGTIWKFTPREWWQFVTKTIRNQGNHDFVLSRALRHRPKHMSKGKDQKMSSSDITMRCVNPLDWTVDDWTNELVRI